MQSASRARPTAVRDDLARAWEEMAALNRRLQAHNDPLSGVAPAADPPSPLEARLRRADMPIGLWQRLRSGQQAGEMLSASSGRDALVGGAKGDGISESKQPAVAQRPDPRRTEVFQPGPDGKLHPVPGWHTTGPFEFGTWGKNIDWGGVGRDVGDIAAGVAGSLMAGVLGPFEVAGILGDTWNQGRQTWEEQDKTVEKPRRR